MNAGDLHKLARVLRAIATAATAEAGEAPPSAGDIAIVEDIAGHEGTSIGEIARRTGLAQSLVSTTVAAMRDAGVVSTSPDPADRRRLSVRIDARARTHVLRARAAEPVEPALRAHLPDASDEELDRLLELLDAVADRLAP